jgi:hypothetical protein
VSFSRVLSVILTAERSFHFQLRQNMLIPGKPPSKIAIVSVHPEDAPSEVLILDHEFKSVASIGIPDT